MTKARSAIAVVMAHAIHASVLIVPKRNEGISERPKLEEPRPVVHRGLPLNLTGRSQTGRNGS